jgi:hypothetical protein
VADERKYGILEGQLCLPITRRLQFGVKCGVVLVLGVFLGGLLPWLLEALGVLTGFPSELLNKRQADLSYLGILCLISFGTAFVSFYASTLTHNLFQAMGAAILVGIVLVSYANWALTGGWIGNYMYLWFGSPLVYVGFFLLAALMVQLGFENYKSLLIGWSHWFRNSFAIVASMAGIVVCTTLVYNRAWEWLIHIEQRHGPAQLTGPVQPQILTVGKLFGTTPEGEYALGYRVFILLPDGRVWVATKHSFKNWHEKVSVWTAGNKTERLVMPRLAFPVKGNWASGSNWVQLACDASQVFGIKSDGTLWRLFSVSRTNVMETLSAFPIPERIGTDTNWERIVAGELHFLALKKNGSLWGLGNNHEGQLGPGPEQVTNDWARVGRDTDWFSVFASGNTSVGVKQDGSVWKWGYLPANPTGTASGWKTYPHPEPVRWGSQGTAWRQFVSLGGSDLILNTNGSLSVGVKGDLYSVFNSRYGLEPRLMESETNIKAIASDGATLVRLTRNGAMLRGERSDLSLIYRGNIWQPSRYSDWIAIHNDAFGIQGLALAADGTLCSWPDLNVYRPRETGLWLGPSRGPLWSMNIIAGH